MEDAVLVFKKGARHKNNIEKREARPQKETK